MAKESNTNKRHRDSNMELLRIVAMFMVMVLHADFLANGLPSVEDYSIRTLSSLSRVLFECLSAVAVNVFVLISGWFGMKFKWKSVLNILFQCFFYAVCILAFFCFYDNTVISGKVLFDQLYPGRLFWFVPAYLGLLILSPVLNGFIENSSKESFRTVLVVYMCFQLVYGWFLHDVGDFVDGFNEGYSLLSFIGLYLLARYARIHRPAVSCMSAGKDMLVYLVASLATGALIIASTYADGHFILGGSRYKFLEYNSPFLIIASISLLLAFSKFRMPYLKLVNYLASSSFAIYLIHINPLIFPHYKELMKNLYSSYDGLTCIAVMLVAMIAIGLACMLADKARIAVWNLIVKICPSLR